MRWFEWLALIGIAVIVPLTFALLVALDKVALDKVEGVVAGTWFLAIATLGLGYAAIKNVKEARLARMDASRPMLVPRGLPILVQAPHGVHGI